MTHRIHMGIWAMLLAHGCTAGGGDDASPFGEGTHGGVAGEDSSTEEMPEWSMESDPGESTGFADDSTGFADDDTAGASTQPCTALDLVLVVDNSLGMADEQTKLAAVIDGFAQQLAQSMPAVVGNIHIAVLTSDDPEFVVPAVGAYASGQRFMTDATLAPDELRTAIAVGESGSPNERPMQMLVDALDPARIAPGGPNAGFLRHDALLAVVIVSDEEDDLEAVTQWGSQGDPEAWMDALVEHTGGAAGNVVALSITGMQPVEGCDAEVAERIIDFTTMAPHGHTDDACASDYTAFTMAGATAIAAACAEFTPP